VAEFKVEKMRIARLSDDGQPSGEWFDVEVVTVDVTPSEQDEYVTIPVLDLVGKDLERDDGGGRAEARHEDGFVIVEYVDLGAYCRVMFRDDMMVKVRRRPG
jgi:hypothetical protein